MAVIEINIYKILYLIVPLVVRSFHSDVNVHVKFSGNYITNLSDVAHNIVALVQFSRLYLGMAQGDHVQGLSFLHFKLFCPI